jgi:hypothetical protein
MTSIKIDELNVSNFEFMHQLTDEELLAINGGWLGSKIWNKTKEAAKSVKNFLSDHPIKIPGTGIEIGSSGAEQRSPGDFGINYSGNFN